MRGILLLLLAATCLLFTVQGYTLDGPWKLTVDSSYKQIQPDTEIVFNFRKTIRDGQIVNQVTIYTCYVLVFTYTLEQNAVVFTYERTLPSYGECQGNDDKEIRYKMQKAFFTATLGDNLLFLSPSGKYVFKLTKVKTNENPETLAGVWVTKEAQNKPVNIISRANGTLLQFCGGAAEVEYEVKKNEVKFSIKKAKGCGENSYLSALYRSRYFRKRKNELWFYDSEFTVTFKWESLAKFDPNEPLPSRAMTEVDSPQASSTVRKTEEQKPEQKVPQKNIRQNGQAQVQGISPANPKAQSQSYEKEKLKTQLNVPDGAENNSESQGGSLRTSKQQEKPKPEVSDSAASPQTIQKGQTQNKVQENYPTKQQENTDPKKQYINSLTKEAVIAKWYSAKPEYESKFLIITPTRIMIYGSCGVYFTTFKFSDPSGQQIYLQGINVKNTSGDCKVQEESLAVVLSSAAYAQVIDNGEIKVLELFSKGDDLLGKFTSQAQT